MIHTSKSSCDCQLHDAAFIIRNYSRNIGENWILNHVCNIYKNTKIENTIIWYTTNKYDTVWWMKH